MTQNSVISEIISTTIASRVGALAENVLTNNAILTRCAERMKAERAAWEALPFWRKIPGYLRGYKRQVRQYFGTLFLAIKGTHLYQDYER